MIKIQLTEDDLRHAVQLFVATEIPRACGMVIKDVEFRASDATIQVGPSNPHRAISAEVTLEEQPPGPDAWGR